MKLGGSYEAALHEVLTLFDTGFQIEHGVWVVGPDGAREVDVLVTGSFNNTPVKILFECKDYSARRRLGIGVVDAFESKIRDLSATGGVICSNVDFAEPAREKAKRKSIGLVAILRSDAGKKFEIHEIFERREIEGSIKNFDVDVLLDGPADVCDADLKKPVFGEHNILQLAAQIHYWGVISHPIVNGRASFRYSFPEPIKTGIWDSKKLTGITVTGDISGVWLRRKLRITGKNGLYDWLSRSVLPATGSIDVSYHDALFDNPKHWVRSPKIMSFEPKAGFRLMSCVGTRVFSEWAHYPRVVDFGIPSIELLTPVVSLQTSMSKRRYQKRYEVRVAQDKK